MEEIFEFIGDMVCDILGDIAHKTHKSKRMNKRKKFFGSFFY